LDILGGDTSAEPCSPPKISTKSDRDDLGMKSEVWPPPRRGGTSTAQAEAGHLYFAGTPTLFWFWRSSGVVDMFYSVLGRFLPKQFIGLETSPALCMTGTFYRPAQYRYTLAAGTACVYILAFMLGFSSAAQAWIPGLRTVFSPAMISVAAWR
jgi:hypothetical protein